MRYGRRYWFPHCYTLFLGNCREQKGLLWASSSPGSQIHSLSYFLQYMEERWEILTSTWRGHSAEAVKWILRSWRYPASSWEKAEGQTLFSVVSNDPSEPKGTAWSLVRRKQVGMLGKGSLHTVWLGVRKSFPREMAPAPSLTELKCLDNTLKYIAGVLGLSCEWRGFGLDPWGSPLNQDTLWFCDTLYILHQLCCPSLGILQHSSPFWRDGAKILEA